MEFTDINCEYKRINGFDDYFITIHGDVYSVRRRGNEKEPKLRKLKPKDPGKASKYLNIILCRDGEQCTKSIHRLVAEHFVDGYFEGAVVNHIDGNNRNNDASNLEWVTTRQNIQASYITSGLGAKRNYKEWMLYSPENVLIGVFTSHNALEEFVTDRKLDASPTMLTKHGKHKGYYVIKRDMTRNCNDYPQGVH